MVQVFADTVLTVELLGQIDPSLEEHLKVENAEPQFAECYFYIVSKVNSEGYFWGYSYMRKVRGTKEFRGLKLYPKEKLSRYKLIKKS